MPDDRVCVIGAGSSGLAAARNLVDCGFEADILEAQPDLGGLWNYSTDASRVYASATMISSKPFTQFPDFPMPEVFPDYPSHTEVLAYLADYARNFGIDRCIRFNRTVENLRRSDETGAWLVSTSDGNATTYSAVIVANGHNWSPRWPNYPGEFGGMVIHSAGYRTPKIFTGKRVLVVGRGNSGCDIAVEAAQCASRVVSSGRRGYHFIPRYLAGRPADQIGDYMLRKGIPLGIRRALAKLAIRAELGDLAKSGLPAPDHDLFETHPIINTDFPLAVCSGAIVPKPEVTNFAGNVVHFADGTSEPIDLVVMATGYRIELPFLATSGSAPDDLARSLHLNVFHPAHDDLFFAGFIQPDSGQFALVHWQMRAVALYLRGCRDGSSGATRLRETKRFPRRASTGGVSYVAAPRHTLEVEHWSYIEELRALVAELET